MKRKITLLFLSIIIIPLLSISQEIRIVDKETNQGIEFVFIFNLSQTQSTITNHLGFFNLSHFNSTDTLILQHPSYGKAIYPVASIGKKITLKKQAIDLEQVVVTANKWEQNIKDVPNKIATIRAKEISFKNPQTSADLIEATGKVFVQKSQLGGGSPMIRGFSANSVLLVVDGVRMNNCIFRSGNLQNIINLDANIVSNSEVIFGPGSIIYGSDALGGVMDFHIKEPAFSNKPDHLNVSAMTRYSSANKEKTGHIDINYSAKKWAAITSISYSDYSDLQMGDNGNNNYTRNNYVDRINGIDSIVENSDKNIQKNSGYKQINLMQKVKYKASDHLTLDYGIHYSNTGNIPRYDRLIQSKNDKLKYAEWYYGPQLWIMNNFSASITDVSDLFDDLKITLAIQNNEESRHDRKYRNSWLRSRTEKVNAYSTNFDFNKQLSSKAELFYGAEAVINTLSSTGISKNIENNETKTVASRYPDGDNRYQTYALYSVLKYSINNKLVIQTGARYSFIDIHSEFDNNTFYNFPYNEINQSTGAFTGSIGGVYHTNSNWEFHSNLSSGFRAPNIDDIAKVFDSEPGNIIVPNENLNPEYAYNIDFTIKKTICNKAVIEGTVFYTYLDNAMVRRNFTLNGQDSIMYDDELSKVEAIVNAGNATIYGGSIFAEFKIASCLKTKGNITFTKGEDNDGFPIRHVAPTFANIALIYEKKNIKMEINSIFNDEISYDNLSLSERDKEYMYAVDDNGNPYSPSWWTLNFKSSYQINKNFYITAGIENIFDVRYRQYSSGIVAPGRNFIFSIRTNF